MRSFVTSDEKLIQEAEAHSAFYAGNLHEALKNNWAPEIVLQYRRWAAQAALTLGEFDQAETLVAGVPELADIAVEIEEARKAEAADDDDHCDCRHFIDGRLSDKEPEKLIEVSSYGERFRYRSNRYNQVVGLYKCAMCGHVNAHPDSPDDLHETALQIRAAADKRAREILRIAKGQAVTVPSNPIIADRNHYPPQAI